MALFSALSWYTQCVQPNSCRSHCYHYSKHIFGHVNYAVLCGYCDMNEVQSLVYIIKNSLAFKYVNMENIWLCGELEAQVLPCVTYSGEIYFSKNKINYKIVVYF